MPNQSIEVIVFRFNKSKPPAKVDPSQLEVTRGEVFDFIAPGGTDLQVLFPNHYSPRPVPFRIVSPNPCPWILWASPNEILLNIPAGQRVSVQVLNSAETNDHYPYAVYCKRINAFAEGNSDPEIIIL
jgi:hypothetical protein